MSKYLNRGESINYIVDKRERRSFANVPKISLLTGCKTLRVATTPECQLNFSFSYTKTHTYSCMRADDFSEVFA